MLKSVSFLSLSCIGNALLLPKLYIAGPGRDAAAAAAAKSLKSRPTLCHPIDSNLPGSPVPGILQARTLEWVAISFSSE